MGDPRLQLSRSFQNSLPQWNPNFEGCEINKGKPRLKWSQEALMGGALRNRAPGPADLAFRGRKKFNLLP